MKNSQLIDFKSLTKWHKSRDVFLESLKEHDFLDDKIPKIKKFSDPSLIESDDLYIISKNTFQELDGLIQDLEMHNDSSPIQELDNMKNASLYCFEITLNDHTVFAIGSMDNMYLKDDQKHILAEFKSNKIVPVTKNLAVFSKNILCLYFKNIEKLLILNPKKTTDALGFANQYQNAAKKIISEEWSVVNIASDSLEKVLKNNINNKALVKIHNAKRLINDIAHYKKYNDFCSNNDNLDLERLTIVDDKLQIEKPKQIEIALHASDNTIV